MKIFSLSWLLLCYAILLNTNVQIFDGRGIFEGLYYLSALKAVYNESLIRPRKALWQEKTGDRPLKKRVVAGRRRKVMYVCYTCNRITAQRL